MRFAANNTMFSDVQFITLKDNNWYKNQIFAGDVVAACLNSFKVLLELNTDLSLKEIEENCERIIKQACCKPTFKGYKGFPGAVCISVNNQLVHGIPSDYKLKPGDLVTIDVGVTYEGAIADSAVTCIYGEPKDIKHVRLIEACQKALYKGIESIAVGKNLGCIGDAIYRYVRSSGFHLITNYGGHGLDIDNPHTQPFVFNKSKRDEGIIIQPGLTIAIEPMLAIGSAKTKTEDDGWTVSTKDISCHMEHTVFVHEDSVEVMTLRSRENFSRKVYFKNVS